MSSDLMVTDRKASTGLDERFSRALHSSARAWRSALDKRMKDLGISQAGWLAIAYIAKAEAPLSQSELAALVQVEAATMVSTLDKLEAANLVIRTASATDRRVKHIRLTVEGEAVYARVKEKADAMRAEILGRISPLRLRAATEFLEELQTIVENSL